MLSNIPSCSKIFTRPDIQLNNSSQAIQVFLSGADTAPNIWNRASSHFQTSLDFFIGEVTDNPSSIRTGVLHLQIVNVENLKTWQCPSTFLFGPLKSHWRSHETQQTAMGSGHLLKGWEHFTPSIEMWPPEGAALNVIKEIGNKNFLVFSFPS